MGDEWKHEEETGTGMPSAECLQYRFRDAGQVIVSADDLGSAMIPASWLALLEAQQAHQQIPWARVWGPVWDWFPAVKSFLMEKCYGVVVLKAPNEAHQLAYICGMSLFETRSLDMLLAGPPIAHSRHLDDRLRKTLEKLPDGLKKFYEQVHDGWCGYNSLHSGPMPLSMLGNAQLPNDFSGSDEKPFVKSELLCISGDSSGRQICLDLKRSTPGNPRATFYDCKFPEYTRVDLDFWKEINEMVMELYRESLPADQ